MTADLLADLEAARKLIAKNGYTALTASLAVVGGHENRRFWAINDALVDAGGLPPPESFLEARFKDQVLRTFDRAIETARKP